MLNVLIAGDNFFDPTRLKARVEEAFGHGVLEIRTKRYTLDCTGFPLKADTIVPSGMCVEAPEVYRSYPTCGVREFYGDPNSLYDEIEDVDVLIIHGAALPRHVIEHAKRLRTVISMRGGAVNIDFGCLKEKGIELLNTSGKNAQAVAEHTVGMILDFERSIAYSNAMLRQSWWWIKMTGTVRGHELTGKTFGLVGYGAIGRRLRKILRGFDGRICAYDPYVGDEVFAQEEVKRMSLEEVLQQSDYVCLLFRQPAGESPAINADALSLMKRDAVLVNTARGALLDYGALKESLESGRLRGAVLDVLGAEPFSFYEDLINRPDVLVTSHIAGQTDETVERGCVMAVDLLRKVMERN